MKLRLTITRIIDNPNYDPKKDETQTYFRGGDIQIPRTFEETALLVELTEEQFCTVKKAVLEVM